jgi:hypothetical protein
MGDRLKKSNGKWLSVYHNKLSDVHDRIVQLCIQRNKPFTYSPSIRLSAWAAKLGKYLCSIHKYNAYNVDALCIETSENVYCCIVGNSSSGTKGNIDLWEPVDANIAE